MTKLTGRCSVFTPNRKCPCGGSWKRVQHPTYPFTHPICSVCEEPPRTYEFRKFLNGHASDFGYTSKGVKLKNLDDVYSTSMQIENEYLCGSFSKYNYKKKKGSISISDTIDEFIQDHIFTDWKKLHMTLEDKIWIEDFMQPFFAEVGVFTVSEIHLWDFIKTFRLKGEDKDRAKRLFEVITREIKI